MRARPRRSIAVIGLGLALLVAALPNRIMAQPFNAAQSSPSRHSVRGMVLDVDAARHTVVVSHDTIPGVMPAMTMPFEVGDRRELDGLVPGAIVSFTLVLARDRAHIEGVRVVRYESVEQDPLTARRLRLLQDMTRAPAPFDSAQGEPVAVGQAVPDFTLTDQTGTRVSLSQFRGRVVALNFVYTSCVLPQFCYRLANHFNTVQRRFKEGMGQDLVLLTVTFDPARDTPERLAEYARQWNADPAIWRFLTGGAGEIQRVSSLLGVDAFPDEGLISHSTRTVVIDRQGVLAASIEGNQYTAAQLSDLLDVLLGR